MTTLEEVQQTIGTKGIEFFLASFVEMNGASKAKLVPSTHIEALVADGAGFAGYAAGEMGLGPHDADIAGMPDLDSLTILPWRPNIAWLAGNIHVDGNPWRFCPRSILNSMRDKAAADGYVYKHGVEPEFFLVKRNETGGIDLADPLDILDKPCYDQRTLSRNLDLLTSIIKHMQELGWNPYANDHEDANCQFEINWEFDECLKTADRHTFYKYMVRTIAEQHGLTATFMAKPFSHLTGNGAHFHMSLWGKDTDNNLFYDESDPNGLSKMAYHWIGGLKAHAKAAIAVTAPSVNSYKRLIAATPRSGASWAPVYISYGGNNRTQMLRLPGPGRVEDRTIDGSCNPYLAAAVTLAAGLDGIKRELPAGEPNHLNMYEVPTETLRELQVDTLPETLCDALNELEKDEVIQDALGHDYAKAYIHAKREEWKEYHNSVSQWEIDHYLNIH